MKCPECKTTGRALEMNAHALYNEETGDFDIFNLDDSAAIYCNNCGYSFEYDAGVNTKPLSPCANTQARAEQFAERN